MKNPSMASKQEQSLPPGYRVFPFAELDSTNAEALRRLAGPGQHFDVIQAVRQTAGKGRRGREWQSLVGNLHASIIKPPSMKKIGQLSFVAGIALGDALDHYAPEECEIRLKWPNDVMLDGRKTAGILIEAEPGQGAVIGIGVNIATAPKALAKVATCLKTQGFSPVDSDILLTRLCHRLNDWYAVWQQSGFAPVREAWLTRAAGIGQKIEARMANASEKGIFAGIDSEGALILDRPEGGRQIIPAGEIYFSAV